MIIFRPFVWLYRGFIRALLFFGLLTWIVFLPFNLAFMWITFQGALDESYIHENFSQTPGIPLDPSLGKDITYVLTIIIIIIGLILLGPWSIMRLITDPKMPRWLHRIVRFLARPSKSVIRFYAFLAGVSAVTSVGLVYFFPDQERLNALTLIYATMFTVFVGYARGIDRALAESDFGDDPIPSPDELTLP